MTVSATSQIEKLRQGIAALESQRALLGDAVVDSSIAAIREQITTLEAEQVEAAPPEERRLITILFTDVVGSTALAEKLDPEEWRESIAKLHATVGNLILQHHGTVAQYLGDGLLAFFGAQQASESDPENAIRAALDAQQAVASLNITPPIQIRMGIHTGLVVVGELGAEGHKEFTATGDAVNLAARLQSVAPPGGVLISQETYRYVRGVFDVIPQPLLTLKGKSEPLQTYLVRRAKSRAFRMVTRGVMGIQTRTVGRAAEMHQLQSAYLDALESERVVWAQLIGEPGVGKSRLVDDLEEWIDLRSQSVRLLRGRALASETNQSFALVRRIWFERLGIADDTPLSEAEAQWVKGFQDLAHTSDIEPAHALGLLVGLPFKDSAYIGAMRDDPQQVRGRAFVVSRDLMTALRRATPVVMLLEDLHWIDSASWDWLAEVVIRENTPPGRQREMEEHGLFVLASARPEWQVPDVLIDAERPPTSADNPHSSRIRPPPNLSGAERSSFQYLQLDLARLSATESDELVRALLSKVEGFLDALVELVVARSEGVPYFAEELVNLLIDRGVIDTSSEPWRYVPQPIEASQLPQTLQHLLLVRLLSLPLAQRASLQRGSVFGRNFWEGGLEAMGTPEPRAQLVPLQPRGLIELQPVSAFEGHTEWSFHHNLLRDVTYESVLKRERPQLHRAAASWLEQQAARAGREDEFAGALGEHAERAGDLTTAAEWYLRAGEHARRQGATREAKHFFDRALELLSPVESEQRWRALLGREEVLGILGEQQLWSADIAALLALAREMDDPERLAEAYLREENYADDTGHYRSAVRAADAAIAAARRAGNASIEIRALARKVGVQVRLGEMEETRIAAPEVLARAQELGDEPTLATTLLLIGSFYLDSGDTARAPQLYRQQIEIDHRLGNRARVANGLGNLGYAYASLGSYSLARSTLEQALRAEEEVGNRRARAYELQNLGEVYWRAGDHRTARRVLEESIGELAATGDRWGRALSLLYLALVLEHSGDLAGAASRYSEGRDIFTAIGARALVNDALAGLARCALAQGRFDEACAHATDLWQYLTEHGSSGLDKAILAYQTCADIFDSRGESEGSHAAVEAGYRELMKRADKISNPEWRRCFLENVSEHRAIVEMWQRVNA